MRSSTPILLWVQRFAVVAIAVTAPWNIVASHSTAVNAVIIALGWSAWASAAIASLVVLPIGLTAQRLSMPLLVGISILALADGSHATTAIAASACTAVAALCTWSPRVVTAMVQGSAFGQELRFPLRTPVPYILPAVVSWVVYVASVVSALLLLASRQWIAGVVVGVIAVLAASRVPSRIHRLARRWLVIVPAGLVVHDHLVLGETLMVRSHEARQISSAPVSGEEADLTGGVVGRRVRVDLGESAKVVLSAITARTLGTTEALHVQSFAIAPLMHEEAITALTK